MTVYLLHFERAYRHASHYMGYSADPSARLLEHKAGKGARFLEVINEAGIDYCIVRTWPGNRRIERRLKRQHNGRRLCPICRKSLTTLQKYDKL